MMLKKTNKALVKFLMDRKGIEAITITKDKVLLTVEPKFTPQDGEKNYLILERF